MAADTTMEDDRIIRESGIDARVAHIVQPALAGGGFRLVRVRLSGQNGLTLQIMAERPDGTMTVEDCEAASRSISAVLDVEDPIDKAYHLEVSSPGIDRPLVRTGDFAAATSHVVKVDTSVMVAGRKRFRGRIVEVDDGGLVVEADKPAYGEEPRVRIPFEAVAEARLVLTDELIRDALSKDNQARKQAKKRRDSDEDAVSDEDAADQGGE